MASDMEDGLEVSEQGLLGQVGGKGQLPATGGSEVGEEEADDDLSDAPLQDGGDDEP